VHIDELTTAVVAVDIKVTNASLTRNQCLQCVTPRSPPVTHVEIPRLRDATELNTDGMIKFVDIHYHTEPNLSFFSETMTPVCFCSPFLSAIDLQCHVFPFEKLLLNVRLCL